MACRLFADFPGQVLPVLTRQSNFSGYSEPCTKHLTWLDSAKSATDYLPVGTAGF